VAPLSHVVLGTDYPYLPIPATLDGLLKYGFTEQDLAAIERHNALALFPHLALRP
jgi:predicted TIM-barrel fold metal-dependent hydrolase